MEPGKHDFKVYQGDHVLFQVTLKTGPEGGPYTPIDITGLTPKAQIRTKADATEVAAELVCTVVGDPVDGTIQIYLSPEDSTLLTKGDKVWDLEFTSASLQFRDTYLAGKVTVTEQVTR